MKEQLGTVLPLYLLKVFLKVFLKAPIQTKLNIGKVKFHGCRQMVNRSQKQLMFHKNL